jgi:hypothetical protein
MAHIDALVQPGAKESLPSAIPTLLGPHRESPNRASRRENRDPTAVSICKTIASRADRTGEIEYLKTVGKPDQSGVLAILRERLTHAKTRPG